MPVPAPGRLNADATAFVEEHRIRAYEVGPDQRATIVTIANLLQVRAAICDRQGDSAAFCHATAHVCTTTTQLQACRILNTA